MFYGESEEATLVPLSAIYEHPTLGVTGVYVAEGEVVEEPTAEMQNPASGYLTGPVPFRFQEVEVLATGRLEAAVRPVRKGQWVVSLGQNLLGGEEGQARVRPVDWQRVERLQTLQREDLMQELNARKKEAAAAADQADQTPNPDGQTAGGVK